MTFDELSATYRAEMKSQMLSDVRRDLYAAMKRLQNDLRREYDEIFAEDPDSLIGEGLGERRKRASFFVQKVVELRMEKIVKMALRASMGAENTVDKLTEEEREYYEDTVAGSKRLRGRVIKDVKRSVTQNVLPEVTVEKEPIPEEVIPTDTGTENEGEELIERPHTEILPQEDMVVLRILEDLPKIAGPDCDYNLKKEDIVRMPVALASVLIKREKAVRLEVTL
jgi:DNA replication factor GINS